MVGEIEGLNLTHQEKIAEDLGIPEKSIKSLTSESEERVFFELEKSTGKTRGYLTAVLDIGQNSEKWEGKKADIPVVRLEFSPTAGTHYFSVEVKVESGRESHLLKLNNFNKSDLERLAQSCANFSQTEGEIRLAKIAQELKVEIENNFAISVELSEGEIPEYLPYSPEDSVREDNLKTVDWLLEREKEKGEKNIDVDQTGESLVRVEIGGENFDFLKTGEMFFVLHNTPTIEVLAAAEREGIVTSEEIKDYISLEEEAQKIEATKEQYLKQGLLKGEEKNYRLNDFWAKAKADYGYDAVRRLSYLEIGSEPVMDEFEKDYISLLGANAARYDSTVLEVGFGMGISANSIMEELVRQQEKEGKDSVYVIIEYNHDVAEKAREWGKRQKIPVVVLEGDWQEEIKKIPEGMITGALADPYPLDPNEKHEDAARALKELHRVLRPGGVVSYYPDSQYCLSKRHAELAEEAKFKYIGTTTAQFNKPGKNTKEYFLLSDMALPVLYKAGGTGSARVETVQLDFNKKRELIWSLFIKNPKEAREKLFRKRFWSEKF